MTILVCGGRDFRDEVLLTRVLDCLRALHGNMTIVHGAARGADRMAEAWAVAHEEPAVGFAADWEREGRAAGPRRNQRMLDDMKPDLVVAFPGGAGTADMVRRAHRAGVRVMEIKP